MKSSKQEIIINHRAKDLYKIVLDIERLKVGPNSLTTVTGFLF